MTEILYFPSAFSSVNISKSLTQFITQAGTDRKTEQTSAPHLKRKNIQLRFLHQNKFVSLGEES